MPARTKTSAVKATTTPKTPAGAVKSTKKPNSKPSKAPEKPAAKSNMRTAAPKKRKAEEDFSAETEAEAKPPKTMKTKNKEPAAAGPKAKKRKAEDDAAAETEGEAKPPKTKNAKTKKPTAAEPKAKKRKAEEDSSAETEVETKPSKTRNTKTKEPAAAGPKAKKRKAEDDGAAGTEVEAKPPKSKNAKTKEPAAAEPQAKKRKAEDDGAAEREPDARKTKKTKKKEPAAAQPKAAKSAHAKPGPKINDTPTQVLDVYVFGEGSSGELGLGSVRVNGKKPIDVKRPRLNDNLSAKSVGILQAACGGMHALALTRDHKILTWGVNDQGALGRDTAWDGNLRDADMDEGSDAESDDDSGINPLESTPTALSDDFFVPGTRFSQIVACDSASFLLTEDGQVYGWGTFRSSDGILGFNEKVKVQQTPVLLPALKNIKALAAGTNHILALDHKGCVHAWGCGQQNQLGRRIIERNKLSCLTPQGIGLPRGKIFKIACGAYHSFALDKDGNVWGWGLNNFGEIGVEGNAGEDEAVILKPAKLDFFDGHEVTSIDGGVHHSVACTSKGELLTWGRVDGFQVGFEQDQLNKDDVLFDEHGKPRILVKPTMHSGISNVVSVSAGTDNSFAVTKDGKVYSWGFSANYQTGQGTIEDIHTPTLINNSAIRDKKILAAHAGGQFSVLVAAAEGVPKTNGVNGI